MPTTYTDQAYPVDIAAVNDGDTMSVVSITLVDTDDDGLIEVGETVNGFNITAIYVGDTVTVDGVLITGATIVTSGGPFFTPNDGSVLVPGTVDDTSIVYSSTSLPVNDLGPPCFVKGTQILTPMGYVAVEDLRAGDVVTTRDNGPRVLTWTGQARTHGRNQFAPVRFEVGSIGNTAVLEVSQQHRMLLCSIEAELNFGENEVLIAAKHLTYLPGVSIVPRDSVEYCHLMFDTHEIVCADGCWSESFYCGEQEVAGLEHGTRAELQEIFGAGLKHGTGFEQTSRYCVKAFEVPLLM